MNNYSEIQKDKPIIFDTCIFMVGIDKRHTDSKYSLENMRRNWIDDVLSYFKNILLHEVVYNELDSETKKVIYEHVGKNVTIVDDKDLFDSDPAYMRIFNEIHDHLLMQLPFSKQKIKEKSIPLLMLAITIYLCFLQEIQMPVMCAMR